MLVPGQCPLQATENGKKENGRTEKKKNNEERQAKLFYMLRLYIFPFAFCFSYNFFPLGNTLVACVPLHCKSPPLPCQAVSKHLEG